MISATTIILTILILIMVMILILILVILAGDERHKKYESWSRLGVCIVAVLMVMCWSWFAGTLSFKKLTSNNRNVSTSLLIISDDDYDIVVYWFGYLHLVVWLITQFPTFSLRNKENYVRDPLVRLLNTWSRYSSDSKWIFDWRKRSSSHSFLILFTGMPK